LRIPIEIERVCAASPDAVLAALRHAGEWRESALPADLRDQDLRALRATVGTARFRLEYFSMGRVAEPPHLTGRVLPHARATVLRAQCRRRRGVFVGPAVVGGGAALAVIVGGGIDWVTAAVALLSTGLASFHYYALPAAADRQVAYLLDRLDAALDSVEAPAATSTRTGG
jgi:hypothetical protein